LLCQPGTLSCYTKILSVLALTGTYVDAQIVPGFYYRVRRVGGDNDDYLFNGEPRQLMSVGMGYGKRVTFKGDNALDNSDFYFYSDTEQEGFAFIPAVPENKTKFCMIDGNGRLIADVKVTDISRHQIHINSDTLNDAITSRLSIDFTCDIDFHAGSGGYFPLHSSITDCALHGIAVMCRSGSARNAAVLQKIEKIMLSHNPGSFTLVPC